jgi:ferric enterobactin receptor
MVFKSIILHMTCTYFLVKRLIPIFCFMCFILFNSMETSAQESRNFKGLVLDSAKRIALPFASVYLLGSEKGNAFQKAAVTNSRGFFEFKNIQTDTFTIRIHYPSYRQKLYFTQSSISEPEIKEFLLPPIEVNLQEVKIIAQSLVSQSIDKITYNVERDPQSNTANMLNIIEKVPLLSVDGAESIKFQGSSSFRILLNGRPSASLSRNVTEALKSMPANSVKSIEVITNPSGKYYQEGATGVINIITKKNKADGYEGTVYLEYKTPAAGPSMSASLNIKLKKISLNTFFGYLDTEKPETTKLYQSTIHSPTASSSLQTGTTGSQAKSASLSEDFNYEIDSLNLLTARVGLYNERNREIADLDTRVNALEGSVPTIQYGLLNSRSAFWKGLEAAVDYQRNFANKTGRALTISYLFTNSLDDQDNTVDFVREINYTGNDYIQQNTFQQLEHTAQLDYTYPFKKLVIDAGFKGIFRFGESQNSSAENVIGNNVPLSGSTNYTNDQYIPGVYASLKYQNGKLGILMGARGEETVVRATFSDSKDRLKTSYFNLFPNFSLNYALDKVNSLNLVYNNTIQRPNISYLNPFINRLNPTLEITGNPELAPVKINSFNLQYRRFKKSSLILALSYSYSDNTIQRLVSKGAEPGISRFTFGNIGNSNTARFSLSYNVAIGKSINVNASHNTVYTKFNGDTGSGLIENSGFSYDYAVGLSAIINATTQFSGRYSYSTPTILLQAKTTTYPYFVFSGTKTFYKKKIGLTASLINPFSKYRFISTSYSGLAAETFSRSELFYRTFLIRASYKFGEIRSRIRRNEKGIKNNDSISIK